MTKKEISTVVRELQENRYYDSYPSGGGDFLFGVGLSDFPLRKMVPKEAIVNFLSYQCRQLNGKVDTDELENCINYLTEKKVIMV